MSKKKETMPIKSKSKYLDEDWQLSPEDQKEYKGFGKKEEDATEEPSGDEEAEVAFPCFALMYRLRKEYVDTTIESVLAELNALTAPSAVMIGSPSATSTGPVQMQLTHSSSEDHPTPDNLEDTVRFEEEAESKSAGVAVNCFPGGSTQSIGAIPVAQVSTSKIAYLNHSELLRKYSGI